MIDEYSNWIAKNIPFTADWEEEVNYMIHVRDSIHNESHGKQSNQLRQLDAKWQDSILKTGDGSLNLEMDRSQIPRSKWWYWTDHLRELTEEERSTF